MPIIHKDHLTHSEAHFINVLYYTPVGMLLRMDKEHLSRALAKAQLVCHWLEGVLQLINKLDREGK